MSTASDKYDEAAKHLLKRLTEWDVAALQKPVGDAATATKQTIISDYLRREFGKTSDISPFPNPSTEDEKILGQMAETVRAISILCREGRILPALILVYATIDIWSSLVRNDSTQDNRRSDFIKWVEAYMLPANDFPLTSLDLYAARCGMLHALSPTSNLSRGGEAREILYAKDDAMAAQAKAVLVKRGKTNTHVVISIPALFDAFKYAGSKFLRAIIEDPELRRKFIANGKHLFLMD